MKLCKIFYNVVLPVIQFDHIMAKFQSNIYSTYTDLSSSKAATKNIKTISFAYSGGKKN